MHILETYSSIEMTYLAGPSLSQSGAKQDMLVVIVWSKGFDRGLRKVKFLLLV